MNYRHAFHAGNFADVLKHLCLARVLAHLREKPTPFRIIDTHAGAGLYDLASEEAGRTGEWREGIGRLGGASLSAPAAELLAPYLDLVRAANAGPDLRYYPGSPLIAFHLLRPQDRLLACELEPQAAEALGRRLRAAAPPDTEAAARAKVLEIDGWTALNAGVPPRERRGLVVIDPPYEQPDDFARVADAAVGAHRKWPTGIYLVWYPIKTREGPDRIQKALQRAGVAKGLRIELRVSTAASGLGACGIVLINPPWNLRAELELILPVLADRLGRDGSSGYLLRPLDGAASRATG
jgi:23S rRNA (adenine2030-N6)-methyltransferase